LNSATIDQLVFVGDVGERGATTMAATGRHRLRDDKRTGQWLVLFVVCKWLWCVQFFRSISKAGQLPVVVIPFQLCTLLMVANEITGIGNVARHIQLQSINSFNIRNLCSTMVISFDCQFIFNIDLFLNPHQTVVIVERTLTESSICFSSTTESVEFIFGLK
jgi:hypothetical protein